MFGHYLPNKNEGATVAPKSKFRELNMGWILNWERPYQKVVIFFEERREGCAKFLNICIDVTSSTNDLHKFISIRSKLHGHLWSLI